jgi:phage terminase small subunit
LVAKTVRKEVIELTQKQQKFVEEYLKSGNATQSAIKAGYSKKTAKEVGCENLTKPNIKAEIEKINKETHNANIATIEEIKEFFSETIRDQFCDRKDRISAAKELAKIQGAYIDKVELSGGFGVQIIDNVNGDRYAD